MKKIFLLFFIPLLAITAANAQSGWVSYKLDRKLSVKVPAEPAKVDENSVMAKSADGGIFLITIVDFKKVAGIDSAALTTLAPTAEFANGLRTGMLGQMPGFTLGDVKPGKWNGYYCYAVDGGNAGQKLKVYTFMVIIGDMMYSISSLLPEGTGTKPKDDFFNSLALN